MPKEWEAELEAMLAQSVEIARQAGASVELTKRISSPPPSAPMSDDAVAAEPIVGTTSEREEIKRRIEVFRVQQRRFAREREDYAAEIIARMRKPESKS